jgi:hypothetical protein
VLERDAAQAGKWMSTRVLESNDLFEEGGDDAILKKETFEGGEVSLGFLNKKP